MKQSRMADTQSLGLDAEKVAELLKRVRQEVDEGLLPAAQVALARDGKVGVFESYGAAAPESLTPMFSATKAVTSAAAWLLFAESLTPAKLLGGALVMTAIFVAAAGEGKNSPGARGSEEPL